MHPLTDRNLLHRVVALSLPVNAPAGPERIRRIINDIVDTAPETILDIGCGVGEMLLGVIRQSPATLGIGLDINHEALGRAARRARCDGLADRLTLRSVDAATTSLPEHADVTVCVGSSHAVGGLAELLTRVRSDRLLIGEGFWVTDQPGRWQDVFGVLPTGLSGLATACRTADWTVEDAQSSDPWEWDAFERDWCAQVARSGLPGARAYAAQRWQHYIQGYRGRLGFGWLWLSQPTR